MYCFCSKKKTAYEMRISDGSSDVCSSDLSAIAFPAGTTSLKEPGLSEDKLIPGLRALADAVHAAGSKLCVQSTHRSEARRVGKECVSTCRSRWSPSH